MNGETATAHDFFNETRGVVPIVVVLGPQPRYGRQSRSRRSPDEGPRKDPGVPLPGAVGPGFGLRLPDPSWSDCESFDHADNDRRRQPRDVDSQTQRPVPVVWFRPADLATSCR